MNFNQTILYVDEDEKYDKLSELIVWIMMSPEYEDFLPEIVIFATTKDTVNYIYEYLSDDYDVSVITGDHTQAHRRICLNDFANGNTHILVATHGIAKKLKALNADNVINFDCPDNINLYTQSVLHTRNRGFVRSYYNDDYNWNIKSDLIELLRKNGNKIPVFLTSDE